MSSRRSGIVSASRPPGSAAPVRTSAIAPPHRLAAQPALQHGGRVLFPGRGAHGRAVGEHDHYRCTRSAEPGQQVGLGRGQVDVGAVEALGLGDGGQAEVGHDDVGARRDPHGLLGQRRVLGRVVDPEPRGVVDLRVGQRGDQLVQRGVDPGGVDLRAARALVARRGGERPHDGDPARARQGEHPPSFLQQHHAGRRGPAGEGVVRGVGHVGGRAGAGPLDEPQHAGDRVSSTSSGSVPSATASTMARSLTPEVRRHLQIQPGGQRGNPVGHRTPVGHHQPVETPLLAQHLGEQPPVLGGVRAVDLVVGAHDRPRPGGGDHVLERGQVDLAQRALVDLGVDAEPVGLLVVGGEVLDAGAHPLALQPLDEPGRDASGQVRVLGDVLEVAPAQRRTLDVDTGPEHDGDALRPRLARNCRTHLAASSGSHAEPSATAGGKQVAGRLPPMPAWSPPSGWRRRPCGPSESTSASTSCSGIGAVCHMSEPRHSAAFCATVNADSSGTPMRASCASRRRAQVLFAAAPPSSGPHRRRGGGAGPKALVRSSRPSPGAVGGGTIAA